MGGKKEAKHESRRNVGLIARERSKANRDLLRVGGRQVGER